MFLPYLPFPLILGTFLQDEQEEQNYYLAGGKKNFYREILLYLV